MPQIEKHFVNYDNAEDIFGGYASAIKAATPRVISYTQWQALTPEQKSSGNYVVTDYPAGGSVPQPDWNQTDSTAADYIKNKPNMEEYAKVGTIPVNPSSTTGLNIWIVDE